MNDMIWINKLLTCASALFLTTTGDMIYAFVFDCEPLSEAALYEMDRDVFNHTNDNWNSEFMSFGEWISYQEAREDRMHEWISNIADRAAIEFAEIFDPESNLSYAVPAWATGERE